MSKQRMPTMNKLYIATSVAVLALGAALVYTFRGNIKSGDQTAVAPSRLKAANNTGSLDAEPTARPTAAEPASTSVTQTAWAKNRALGFLSTEEAEKLALSEEQWVLCDRAISESRRTLMANYVAHSKISFDEAGAIATIALPKSVSDGLRNELLVKLRSALSAAQLERLVALGVMDRVAFMLDNFGTGGVVYSIEGDGQSISTSSNFKVSRSLGVDERAKKYTSGDYRRGTFVDEYGAFALKVLSSGG